MARTREQLIAAIKDQMDLGRWAVSHLPPDLKREVEQTLSRLQILRARGLDGIIEALQNQPQASPA